MCLRKLPIQHGEVSVMYTVTQSSQNFLATLKPLLYVINIQQLI